MVDRKNLELSCPAPSRSSSTSTPRQKASDGALESVPGYRVPGISIATRYLVPVEPGFYVEHKNSDLTACGRVGPITQTLIYIILSFLLSEPPIHLYTAPHDLDFWNSEDTLRILIYCTGNYSTISSGKRGRESMGLER